MIARAQAILDALLGAPVSVDVANRVIAAFLPEDVDIELLTNEEKATYFVREMRRLAKQKVLRFEELAASEAAMLAARADVEANVDIGSD